MDLSPSLMPSERLEAELVAHAAWENAGIARMLAVLREFDERRCWATWGCMSPQQWLSWKCGLGYTAATERLRVSHILPSLPALSAAFADGRLSWSKVREITRVATAVDEESWATIAEVSTAAQLARLVSAARKVTRRDAARQIVERAMTWQTIEDGSVEITLRLPADQAMAMIGTVRTNTTPQKGVKLSVSMVDTIVEIVNGGGHTPAEVVVHVHDDGRVHLDDGPAISAEIAECLACDGTVTTIMETPAGPIEIDTQKTASARQRRHLARLHPCCQFPGCHHAGRFEAHHVIERAKGGKTRLWNLSRLCWFHHRMVHLLRLVLTLHKDRTLTVTTADGHPIDRPIPPIDFAVDPPDDPNRLGGWLGDHLDINACFDALGYNPIFSAEKPSDAHLAAVPV